MNQYSYLGSAHHLAHTSMVLCALPLIYTMLSSADWSITDLRTTQLVLLMVLSGISVRYFYLVFTTMNQDNRHYHRSQPTSSMLITALVVSMFLTGFYDVLWLVMILLRVDRIEPQPVPFSDYMIFLSLTLSLICGCYALYKMHKLNRAYYRRKGKE